MTDKMELDNCFVFARTLKEHAGAVGISMHVTVINYRTESGEFGHAVNSVILENGTKLFIEPQSDDTNTDLISLLLKGVAKGSSSLEITMQGEI